MTMPAVDKQQYIDLLKQMVATPSYSRQEQGTAELLERWLSARGHDVSRHGCNISVLSHNYRAGLPLLMLNSHHDTVRPAAGWKHDPHLPSEEDGMLFGLGANDAGASVVSLIAAFEAMEQRQLPFNIILAITAEEEVGGENGMRAFLPMLAERGLTPDMVLVGEPTCMQPAIAERGLVVLDCVAHGRAGHAARGEGVNALYRAVDDIARLRNLKLPKVSRELGPVGIAVTMINAGTAHNVVPAECHFTVDVRTTDAYTNEQTVVLIREAIESDAVPRSTRVRASVIDRTHPMVLAAVALGGEPFASPTTSDMSLLHGIPSLKMGPGDSARSHTPDEYITYAEIEQGIAGYIGFLSRLAEIMDINE